MMLPGRPREDANKGGKLIMPPSALDQLTRLNISYPMLFEVYNSKSGRTTHCGVLEFIADEGVVHMPHWMMQNLVLSESDPLRITNVSLPVATFAKFKPQSVEFLDISNPKAVLENTLRSWACLTEGDIIAINYNNKIYEIMVLEVKPPHPSKAVSIVECDLELDFAPPVGYVDPAEKRQQERQQAQDQAVKIAEKEVEQVKEEESKAVSEAVFQTFSGSGNRLDGKKPKQTESVPVVSGGVLSEQERQLAERRARAAAAEARFKPGKLSFVGNSAAAVKATKKPDANIQNSDSPKKDDKSQSEPASTGFVAFGGQGHSLR